MSYDVPHVPGESTEFATSTESGADGFPMWEVFVRARRGLAHVHMGSLHAPDAESALQAARDVYTRRREGVSVWVTPSSAITAFDPDDAEDFIEVNEKEYRHATHYDIPEEVGQM